MRDCLGYDVTPERIQGLLDETQFRSDTASMEIRLILPVLQATLAASQERERRAREALRGLVGEGDAYGIVDMYEDRSEGTTWPETTTIVTLISTVAEVMQARAVLAGEQGEAGDAT